DRAGKAKPGASGDRLTLAQVPALTTRAHATTLGESSRSLRRKEPAPTHESRRARASAAPAHHAGGQTLLGRPPRAEAHAAEMPGVRALLLLSARRLPAMPFAADRLGAVERPGAPPLPRELLPAAPPSRQGEDHLR